MQGLLARLATGLGVALVVTALAAAGVALLFAALFLWLQRVFDPATAALITGLAVLFTAGLLLLVARMAGRPSAKASPSTSPAALAAALGAQAGGLAREQVRSGMRGRGTQALLVAVAAGFALGISPRLRRTLWRWLG